MAVRAGFSEYVVARRPLMYRTAWVLCGDHHQAEDLVQHVLTKLYVVWPRVGRMDSIDGYDQSSRDLDHDALLDLREALAELAPGQRRAVVLRHLWGLSVEETAAELGVAPGTVKSQTADAVRRLRELLAPQREEGPAR